MRKLTTWFEKHISIDATALKFWGGLFLGLALMGALSQLDLSFLTSRNLLTNPGFESGKAGWTVTTATFANESTNVFSGSLSGKLTFSASTGDIAQNANVSQVGGVPMVASCRVKTSVTTGIQVCAISGGTEIQCNSYGNSGNWELIPVNFTGPSGSTTVGVRVKASATATGSVYVDDCYIGASSTPQNFGQVSQAQAWGSATWPVTGSCSWTSSTTGASFTSYSANSSCPTPTVTGNAAAPATKIPAVQLNNVPPGHYQITATFSGYPNSLGDRFCYQLWDGSNQIGVQCARGADSTTPPFFPVTISGEVDYTTAGNHQIEIRNLANTTYAIISNSLDQQSLKIQVVKFPSPSEIAYRPDVLPASWSGYSSGISGGCSTSSTTYADPSSCTGIGVTQISSENLTCVQAASSAPAITCTFNKTGRYRVSGAVNVTFSSTGRASARIVDGSGALVANGVSVSSAGTGASEGAPFDGMYNVTATGAVTFKAQIAYNNGTANIDQGAVSTQAAITWNVEAAGQGTNSPLLMGSVTSTSTGQEHIERATLNLSGASTCTVTSQSGSWISSASAASTICTINIAAGEFSAAPTCTIASNGTGSEAYARFNGIPTTSIVTFTNVAPGPVVVTGSVGIICMGPR